MGVPVGVRLAGRACRTSGSRDEDSYRLCYVRGPEGIIVALAEELS